MAHPGPKKNKITIPPQLRNEKYGFCFDEYKLPFEKEWGKKENTYKYNDARLLSRLDHERNYGVVGGIGGLMITDADSQKVIDAFNKLMETLTISTGNGEHFYYDVPGLDKSYALSEIDEEETRKQTEAKGEFVLVLKNIGHITSTGRQVVGPNCPHYNQQKDGSWLPSGKFYQIKKDLPIRTITKEMVLETIKPFLPENIRMKYENQRLDAKTDIANRLTIPIQKIVDVVLKEHPAWNWKTSTSPPGYRGHNPSHPQSKSRKDLSINTSTGQKYSDWWICSACCHDGCGYGNALYLIALVEGILQCHECKAGGLRGEKFTRVMELAITKYGIPKEAFHSWIHKDKEQETSISIEGDLPVQKNREEELNEGSYIDDDSLIGKYTKYQHLRTNAPRNFGTHLGIQAIGFAMGYKTVNMLQPSEQRHNTNLLIIGPSGKSKKTTAQLILKQVTPQNYYLPDSFSPEGFLAALNDTPKGMVFYGEFSSMLSGWSNGGYMSHMKEIFNDLYSCPEVYYKKLADRKKCFTIEKPYLCINTTCTEDGLIPNLTSEVIHGGSLARFIMVCGLGPYRKREGIPEEAKKQEKEFRAVFLRLHTLFDKEKVIFEFTPDAFNALDVIFRDLEENHRWDGVSPFVARCEDNIVKYADILAMSDIFGKSSLSSLSSLSSFASVTREIDENAKNPLTGVNNISCVNDDNDDNDDNDEKPNSISNRLNEHAPILRLNVNVGNNEVHVLVGPYYVNKAWDLLRPCLEYTRKFVQYVDEDQPVSKVLDIVKRYGPIQRSHIMRFSHLKSTDFKDAVETLKEREEIFHISVVSKVRNREYMNGVFCHTSVSVDKCKSCLYKCTIKDRMPFLELKHEKGIPTEKEPSLQAVTEITHAPPEIKIIPEDPQTTMTTEKEAVFTPTDVKEYIQKVEATVGPGLTDELLMDKFPYSLIAGLIGSQQLVPFVDTSGFHKYTWNKEK